MNIICIGDVGIDYYVNLDKYLIGGISLNYAINAKEQGAEVSIISCIGTEKKEEIINLLKNRGIDFSHLKIKEGHSAFQKIILHNDGRREFAGYGAGVLNNFSLSEKDFEFIKKHDIISCPLSDDIEHIFDAVAEMDFKGIKVCDISMDYKNFSLDLIDEYIGCFDMMFIGGNEKVLDYINTIKIPENKIIIITLGGNGSVAFFNGKKFYQKSIPSRIIDTTGAGDAFQAAFTEEYFKTKDIPSSLQKGAEQATKVIQYVGGILQ